MKSKPPQPISNRFEFMNQYTNDSTNEVINESEKMFFLNHLQEKIRKESDEYANLIAKSIISKENQLPKEFPGINLANNEGNTFEFLKFHLVLDFLKSIGCKFTPGVFRHETQNPSIHLDRSQISELLQLRSYDKTPLLVQLIEVIRTIQKDQ